MPVADSGRGTGSEASRALGKGSMVEQERVRMGERGAGEAVGEGITDPSCYQRGLPAEVARGEVQHDDPGRGYPVAAAPGAIPVLGR